MVAQKFKNLSKHTVCASALVAFSDKTRLHCAERKAKLYGEWAIQHLQFSYVFMVFVFTSNLILPTRRDFFSIQFEKLSLRNRRLN